MLAYLDANAVDCIYRRQAGFDDAAFSKLTTAVEGGRLQIVASTTTAEELLSAVQRSPQDAFALGRVYVGLASLKHCVKEARQLLAEAIQAYARRSGPVTPYLALTTHERQRWEALSIGAVTERDIAGVVRDANEQIEHFLRVMEGAWPAGRAALATHLRRGIRAPTVHDLWPGLAPYYAAAFAARVKALRACQRRGIAGLLRTRPVRATVGAVVGLVHAQAVGGRRPNRGDSRDLLHIIGAASAKAILVSHDKRLKRLAEEIPSLGLEVVRVPELAARL